jgi:hypothetical protein
MDLMRSAYSINSVASRVLEPHLFAVQDFHFQKAGDCPCTTNCVALSLELVVY